MLKLFLNYTSFNIDLKLLPPGGTLTGTGLKQTIQKKKELCILIMVTDTEFNYQLKGRESRIGQFINFPVRCLDGVAISDLKVGDTLAVNGAAVNILTETLEAEVCKLPSLQVPKAILV